MADLATEPTADRLLDAAERIFADEGIEGASVRAITHAAGANIASVHYHFGSKLDLVRAVVLRRVAEVHDMRRAALDDLERASVVGARDIAGVWVRPLASFAFDPTGRRTAYLSFLSVLQSGGPELRPLAAEAFQPQHDRFAALLERALEGVPEPIRWFRFSLAVDTTIRALADVERSAAPWQATGGIGPAGFVDHLIDAVAGLLAGNRAGGSDEDTTARTEPPRRLP